jgi:hypothetical protein
VLVNVCCVPLNTVCRQSNVATHLSRAIHRKLINYAVFPCVVSLIILALCLLLLEPLVSVSEIGLCCAIEDVLVLRRVDLAQ